MRALAINNATIINDGQALRGSVLVAGEKIALVAHTPRLDAAQIRDAILNSAGNKAEAGIDIDASQIEQIDATGKLLLPGAIDDQVHFRTPGLTHKGDIESESRAALAGGITSYMDMPNVAPPTTDQATLDEKRGIARRVSWCNHAFYLGATEDNLAAIRSVDPRGVPGVKLFMGSSTGNLMVRGQAALEAIFAECPTLIATHCEDEATIQANTLKAKQEYGDDIPFEAHARIRDAQACLRSTETALRLAQKHRSRLHILHVSTAEECQLLDPGADPGQKRVTAEVCAHHLWFHAGDYARLGSRIKCNPAIKEARHRDALRDALRGNRLDIVATDHAPHTLDEKSKPYAQCPSGLPLAQHSLAMMLELARQGHLTYPQVAEKMSHSPARLFGVENRGHIRPGYQADLVLADPSATWTVGPGNLLYKCGWSPLEGTTFSHTITHVIVNGTLSYHNGRFLQRAAQPLAFNR